jgi:hypothetical protein
MTSTAPDETARRAAIDFARGLVPIWQAALGTEPLGVYLLGSLAHAGFSRRYSDIDMAVMTETGLSAVTIENVRSKATAVSAEWGPKISVFWADRRFSIGRLPPLDRLDHLDRALVLTERERVRPPRPMLNEIRAYLRGDPFANWAERCRLFAAATMLDAQGRKAYLRALLYPARFCYGYMTGQMGSNDDAVAFLHEQAPAGLDLASIDRALQCRHAGADPDSLFSLRCVLPAQVDACAALIEERAG